MNLPTALNFLLNFFFLNFFRQNVQDYLPKTSTTQSDYQFVFDDEDILNIICLQKPQLIKELKDTNYLWYDPEVEIESNDVYKLKQEVYDKTKQTFTSCTSLLELYKNIQLNLDNKIIINEPYKEIIQKELQKIQKFKNINKSFICYNIEQIFSSREKKSKFIASIESQRFYIPNFYFLGDQNESLFAKKLKISQFAMKNHCLASQSKLKQYFYKLVLLNSKPGVQKQIELFKKRENNPQKYCIIKLYTQDDFFHKFLNRILRKCSSPYKLFYVQPYVYKLSARIKQLYKQQQQKVQQNQSKTYYRGATVHPEQLKKLKENVGKYVQNLGFLSTSQQILQKFVVNARIEIIVQNKERAQFCDQGFAQITKFSQFPDEKETIFNIHNYFRIQSVEPQGDIYVIKLRYGATAELVKCIEKLIPKQDIIKRFGDTYMRLFNQVKSQYSNMDVLFQGFVQISAGVKQSDSIKYFQQLLTSLKKKIGKQGPTNINDAIKRVERIKKNLQRICTIEDIKKFVKQLFKNSEVDVAAKIIFDIFFVPKPPIQPIYLNNKITNQNQIIQKIKKYIRQKKPLFIMTIVEQVKRYFDDWKILECKEFLFKLIEEYKTYFPPISPNQTEQQAQENFRWQMEITCIFILLEHLLGKIQYEEVWNKLIREYIKFKPSKKKITNNSQQTPLQSTSDRILVKAVERKHKFPENKRNYFVIIEQRYEKHFEQYNASNDEEKCRIAMQDLQIQNEIEKLIDEINDRIAILFKDIHKDFQLKNGNFKEKFQQYGKELRFIALKNLMDPSKRQQCIYLLDIVLRYRKFQLNFIMDIHFFYLKSILFNKSQQDPSIQRYLNTKIQNGELETVIPGEYIEIISKFI